MIESLWDAAMNAKALVTGAKYFTMQRDGGKDFFWSACEYISNWA